MLGLWDMLFVLAVVIIIGWFLWKLTTGNPFSNLSDEDLTQLYTEQIVEIERLQQERWDALIIIDRFGPDPDNNAVLSELELEIEYHEQLKQAFGNEINRRYK